MTGEPAPMFWGNRLAGPQQQIPYVHKQDQVRTSSGKPGWGIIHTYENYTPQKYGTHKKELWILYEHG